MAVFQSLGRIRWVVLHATHGGQFESPQALAARHETWPLYHWLVYADGQIIRCASPSRVLYHCDGANVGTLGVAVVGRGVPPDRQVEAVTDLVTYLRHRIDGLAGVALHREVNAVACPGPWWTGWVRAYREQVGVALTRRVRDREVREPIYAVSGHRGH